MDFESHWFDTSQFMNHKTKYMRHNAFCYYSVKHKGNSTAQAALPAGQPEIIKNSKGGWTKLNAHQSRDWSKNRAVFWP